MMKSGVALLVFLAFMLGGCEQADKSLEAEDETNPHIREALTAQREFNFADAAKAYEAALQASPNVARAHFDLGLLYADRLNDPIRAMYHFQCYIDERPNADNREGAQKRLDSIKIQFAATVPNSPIQNAEAFAKLQADNQNLIKDLDDARAQIAALQTKMKAAPPVEVGSTAPPTTVAQNSPAMNPVKDTPDAKADPIPAASPDPTPNPSTQPAGNPTDTGPAAGAPAPTTPTPNTPAPVDSSTPAPATAPTAGSQPTSGSPSEAPKPADSTSSTPSDSSTNSDRTYTVAKGDTLWSIAKKYYPGQINAGIDKIKKANADKLPEGKPLKIGVVLVIP